MRRTLVLHEVAHIGAGSDMSKWTEAYQYEVQGLPPSQQVWIANMNHAWQILRAKDGHQGNWAGYYETAERALAALQTEFHVS